MSEKRNFVREYYNIIINRFQNAFQMTFDWIKYLFLPSQIGDITN